MKRSKDSLVSNIRTWPLIESLTACGFVRKMFFGWDTSNFGNFEKSAFLVSCDADFNFMEFIVLGGLYKDPVLVRGLHRTSLRSTLKPLQALKTLALSSRHTHDYDHH